jgi:ribokinase
VPIALIKKLSAIVPNAGEAEKLTGTAIASVEQAVEAAKHLCLMGTDAAIVKLDQGGCVAAHNGEVVHHQGSSLAQPVDTTGAGDAFTGAFAAALVEGRSIADAVVLGTAAADISVRSFGSQPSYPHREQLEHAASLRNRR